LSLTDLCIIDQLLQVTAKIPPEISKKLVQFLGIEEYVVLEDKVEKKLQRFT